MQIKKIISKQVLRIKRIIFILATIFATTVLLASPRQEKDTLRILAIGNSFSQDAINENFGELCTCAGKHVIVGNMYISGCKLSRHWKNITDNFPDYTYYKRVDDEIIKAKRGYLLSDAIEDEAWDVVTFQQNSALSGDMTTIEPYLGNLVDYVLKHTKKGG